MVVLPRQQWEQLPDVLETLQQDAGVCVEEPQREPLEDEVKVRDRLRRVTRARLSEHKHAWVNTNGSQWSRWPGGELAMLRVKTLYLVGMFVFLCVLDLYVEYLLWGLAERNQMVILCKNSGFYIVWVPK